MVREVLPSPKDWRFDPVLDRRAIASFGAQFKHLQPPILRRNFQYQFAKRSSGGVTFIFLCTPVLPSGDL